MRNLSACQIFNVVQAWRDRLSEVSRNKAVAHTMIFKNEGDAAGASLEHVHSQLLATSFVPPKISAELSSGQEHFEKTGNVVWTEMLNHELAEVTRILFEDDDFVLFCPFASQFPGEMHLFPRKPEPAFENASEANLQSFATLLKSAVECLHGVFPEAPFNLGLHTAPPRDDRRKFYHWHLAITPRLTGIAGFEVASGSWINIVSPEDAASRYREAFRLFT
jgi:UDPglucose--hexose-1-phosphate uridylyltransferase